MRNSLHAPRLVLASLLACALPLAGAHSATADGGLDMAVEPALGVGAALDARGPLWLASVRAGQVSVRHSDDLARTFSQPVIVNPIAEKIYAPGENRPEIAIGAQGQIYVTWTAQPNPQWAGSIRLARSTDGGGHFSAPITVNRDPALVTRGFDSLAVADNGDVLVAGMQDYVAYAYAASVPTQLNFLLDPGWGGELPRTLTLRADGTRSALSGKLTAIQLQHLRRP